MDIRPRTCLRLLLAAFIAVAIVAVAQPRFSEAQTPSPPVLQPFLSGFNAPVFVTHAGDGSGRLFVVERGGTIKVVVNGQLQQTPFLDITTLVKSGSEQGLLGLAFHPRFETNGRFFVFYTATSAPQGGVGDNTLAEYRVSAGDRNRADLASARVLFALRDEYGNHNGGMIGFGPDGYLYVGTGDEGSGGDPKNNAQNLQSLYGKMLRLDVDNGSPYGIPSSNPFASGSDGTMREIWAYGLRNPWRWSFDRQTGDLYIGDVGQGAREEVDVQQAGSRGGENYGWKPSEGSICYVAGCNLSLYTLPLTDYDHGLGCSVTGGYVYRGTSVPSLQGAYLFGDYCTGRIWSLRRAGAGWSRTQLLDTSHFIGSFGEDEAGELYLADLGTGVVYRFAEAPPTACSPRPRVGMVTAPAGAGRLQVTVVAGGGTIQSIRFGAATNALIDAGGHVGRSGNFAITPAAGATQVSFMVRRAVPGAATTVPIVVVDGCGEWPSFVGGGPNAF